MSSRANPESAARDITRRLRNPATRRSRASLSSSMASRCSSTRACQFSRGNCHAPGTLPTASVAGRRAGSMASHRRATLRADAPAVASSGSRRRFSPSSTRRQQRQADHRHRHTAPALCEASAHCCHRSARSNDQTRRGSPPPARADKDRGAPGHRRQWCVGRATARHPAARSPEHPGILARPTALHRHHLGIGLGRHAGQAAGQHPITVITGHGVDTHTDGAVLQVVIMVCQTGA